MRTTIHLFKGLMWGRNESIYAKDLEQGLSHDKHYVGVSYYDKFHEKSWLSASPFPDEETQVQCTQVTCPGPPWQCWDGNPALWTLCPHMNTTLHPETEGTPELGWPQQKPLSRLVPKRQTFSEPLLLRRQNKDRRTYTLKYRQGFKSTSSFAEGKTEAIVLGVFARRDGATPGQIKCFSI